MRGYPLVTIIIPTHNRKDKLIRLIDSILRSNYPNDKLEIIVVDDASTDGTYEEITKRYGDLIDKGILNIVRTKKELFPAGSRNRGIENSTGDYILFIDDDNVVDKNTIMHLVEIMSTHPDIGVCAPLMLHYGTNIIWCAGVKRNMITSKTTYLLNGKDLREGDIPEIIESDDFPNCFMVKSEILKKCDILFDEENFPIHFEESDFCYKIRRIGYKCICYTKAKVWHDVRRSKITGFETEWRTYYTARNRIIFHKKYSKWWQFLIFILIFSPLVTFYYLKQIWTSSKNPSTKLKIMKAYLKGIMDGLFRMLNISSI